MMRTAAALAVLLALGAAGCAATGAMQPSATAAARSRGFRDGARGKDNYGNALGNAARNGEVANLRNLLAAGGDPNGRDSNGSTPLAHAAAGGSVAAAQALLDAGARYDQPEKDKGATMPVMVAILNGNPDVARLLIRHGAQLNARANSGSSALTRAISSGRLEMVRSALDLGADPNEPDASGQTPVHYATYANRPDMVNALVAAGGVKVGVLGRVGLALGTDAKGAVLAQGVIPGSPAEAAGLRKNDRIVSIDGVDAGQMTVAQAVARLRGAPGTAVEIAAARGDAEPVVYKVVREAVGVEAAKPEAAAAAPAVAAKALGSDIDSPAAGSGERPDDFALVIGVEEYQSLPKAEFGVRDAETARRHFAAMGIPQRNIVALEGSAATASKLKSYLQEWLPMNVKEASTLWVYYSGHGAPDAKSGDAFLVPWDGDPKFLKSTAYPLKQFYADLAKTKAKRIVVALDSCFSGAGGRSVLAEGTRPLVVKVDDGAPRSGRFTVLAAASGDETTGTLNEQGHGAFTYFFFKGLSGAAKTAGGAVTPKSLFEYLGPRVQDEAHRQNREQTPTLIGGTNDPL